MIEDVYIFFPDEKGVADYVAWNAVNDSGSYKLPEDVLGEFLVGCG